MAAPHKYLACLVPGNFYHIYNCSNNKERLFLTEANRHFFLHRYAEYIGPFVKTFSYCLLDNHFHFLIKVNSQEKIIAEVAKLERGQLTQKEKELLAYPEADCWCNYFMEWQFLRFFTSYSMSFNKVCKRRGNLFHKPFKRVLVETDSQFTKVLLYIHTNPVKHGLVDHLTDYEWSSYQHYKMGCKDLVELEYVINWFGGMKRFEAYHRHAEFFLDFGKGFAF